VRTRAADQAVARLDNHRITAFCSPVGTVGRPERARPSVLDDPAFDELAAIHEHDPLRRPRNLGEGRYLVDHEIGQEQSPLAQAESDHPA